MGIFRFRSRAFNTPPPKREGSGELVVGLWGQPPSPSDKVTMIRQSSLTRLGVMINTAVNKRSSHSGNGDIQWCFSQVKGTLDDDVTEADPCSPPTDAPEITHILIPDQVKTYEGSYFGNADIISCVEFNHDGDLLATGDKGGRVVIFQRDPISKNCIPRRGEYNVYSTFQSHEPEFDYLKSLEIEEKINKIRWLKRKNQAHFLLSTNDKTIKLWKVSERDKRVEGYNTKEENGQTRDPSCITALRVPIIKPMELMVEASPRRIFANAHTYHINSISVNSDQETYLSADDLRINLWHLEITDQSFNIVDIKPSNMEELTEVITAAEFHPLECNLFVYSSSKGTIRLCDMRQAALCDRHSKLFEEPEDPTNRSFFSEIISSISDVKVSNSGRYMISRDYLSVKVWDLHMETKPIESYPVHEYLRSKLCSLYENDCIFDKFECCWSGNDSCIMTGSYNNFFRMFDRVNKRDATLEAAKEIAKPKTVLKPRKVCTGGKRKKDEISVDCLDFNKKILHTAWHPSENIIAVAATNNLFLLQDKL
ncbi:serine/threonine-protein phosphatase 2A 55 kDa regulatory subunit B beta isoform isoform X3 [Homalodisca vitripennis]|uniref:serine/threonine-protein phosphatase 2A 55 kDa regulatory subunit B beta isoform isoform X3 n=1 Tax=Homalodisca vitripennis TaxID=197043 RepID=UPI001EE9DB57|nr:serine/threonine-protein phosphatase 2A 55 kDa regulatory subunit B beta isoform isoform X3 [Homalodisca vitripennis]